MTTLDVQSGATLVGVSSTEVAQLRSVHGSNVLTPPARDPEWKKFLEKFDDPTIRILLIAAGVSMLTAAASKYVLHGHGGFTDGIGVLLAVLLATSVAYLNERKSGREFELLNKIKEDVPVTVTRDGRLKTISIHDVVLRDVVHLHMGDKIPSDGTLVANLGLTVDESLLTGEPVPVEKSIESGSGTPAEETTFARDRVYRGTTVVDGHGVYVTTAVGDKTEMGKIAQNLGTEEEETPLKQKLTVLAGQISVVGTVAAVLIYSIMALGAIGRSEILRVLSGRALLATIFLVVSGVLGGLLMWRPFRVSVRSWRVAAFLPLWLTCFSILAVGWGLLTQPTAALDLLNSLLLAFVVAVTIVVVAVPEGLPMMVNVSLALNMRKMARQNCLVRKLVASETIGSATVICTDKTGTLTQNRMQPVWFHVGLRSYDAGQIDGAAATPEWNRIVRNIALNSSSNLVESGSRLGVNGNPTEGALLTLLHQRGIAYKDLRDVHRVLYQIDYNSARKLSIAVVEDGERHFCYLKGAPERVLAGCTHISVDGRDVPINGHREAVLGALQHAAGGQGLRVIGFSEKLSGSDKCPERGELRCLACSNRTFLGLIGIADPLRSEVREAVALCRGAGIQVKMITGDDHRTAEAVAVQAGILEPGGKSIGSLAFQRLSDSELESQASLIQVLARSSPADKLRLVQSLRSRGEVVAVTGDGTNDAPALKAADVGLSMGLAGTEVAKEASDIVLLDDDFRSIVTGVRWGRALYENIQRFLQFQLSVNVVALLCALIGPLLGIPLPLTVPQLLWINIIMDTFAALAFSTEPPRAHTMSRPPIRRDAHIITPSMALSVGLNSLYQVVVLLLVLTMNPFGGRTELERLTIFFTVFVMFQFWHKFNCRSLYHNQSPFQLLLQNRMFLIIVGTITLVQIVLVQAGGAIGQLFRTVPLPLGTWVTVLLLTATIMPVAWIVRQVGHWSGAERWVSVAHRS